MGPGIAMLTTSFLAVAGIVLPVVAFAHFLSRKREPFSFPRPFAWRWNSVEVVLFALSFFIVQGLCFSVVSQPNVRTAFLPQALHSDLVSLPTYEAIAAIAGGTPVAEMRGRYDRALQVVGLWASLFAAILFVSLYLWLSTIREGKRRRIGPRVQPLTVRTAGIAWLVIAPIILGINVLVTFATSYFNSTPEIHPLATIGAIPNLAIVFLLSACVATPTMEELLVRGVILPWACREVNRSMIVFLPAAAFVLFGRASSLLGPLTFFGILVLGFWTLLHFGPTREGTKKRVAAIYATSVLFALAHTSVWPTPIPLFFFSLGLGWLALRTGGVTASILVHGLLNAVSSLYVLRGGPM